MDYSKFVDENIDINEWVNDVFMIQKEGSLEQHATNVVMKLQMFIQEVNTLVEDGCLNAVNNFPRVGREIEAVRQESLLLRDQMKIVKQDVEKVEKNTSSSMQALIKLDLIKSQMKEASTALKEADNWTTLSSDVDEIFSSNNVEDICKKIVQMQKCLKLLIEVPDYIERFQYLESLKNNLEAKLTPRIVEAFNLQNSEDAQYYVKIFSEINRSTQINKYFFKCHKGKLIDLWQQLQTEFNHSSFDEWLPDFYDQLLSTWHSQLKWGSQVFEDPLLVMTELLTETLNSLEPMFLQLLDYFLQSQEKNSVDLLITLKKATDRLAQALEASVKSFFYKDHQFLQRDCFCQLAKSLYRPYSAYLNRFGEFEELTLHKDLMLIKLDGGLDVEDAVSTILESPSRLFRSVTSSYERCSSFGGVLPLNFTVPVIDRHLQNYVVELERVLVNIREKILFCSKRTDPDNWGLFHQTLRLVQVCGDLLMRVDKLQTKIISEVELFNKRIGASSPFCDCFILLLNDKDDSAAVLQFCSRVISLDGEESTLFPNAVANFKSVTEQVHKLAFDVVSVPIAAELEVIPVMDVWSGSGNSLVENLPNFGLSPQEYITKVGQYLMTLPQQLEPFITADSSHRQLLLIALHHGRLPYVNHSSRCRTNSSSLNDPEENSAVTDSEELANKWLCSISTGAMFLYVESIIGITELSDFATRQLMVDIQYLRNVFEDLGIAESESLASIESLLNASQSNLAEFQVVAEKTPHRFSTAISKMRGLHYEV